MRHFEAGFQGFLPPSLDTRFPELVRSLFLLLDDFQCYSCDFLMEYFDKHTISTMVVTVFLVFSIFSLCVESSTQFSMTSLHLYHSFILVFPPSPFEIDPLLCFPIKYPPIYKKNNMEYGTHCIPNNKSEHNKLADHKRFHRKMV